MHILQWPWYPLNSSYVTAMRQTFLTTLDTLANDKVKVGMWIAKGYLL